MKKLILSFLTLIVTLTLVSCAGTGNKKKTDAEGTTSTDTEAKVETAVMTFNSVEHDFGTIKEGETVEHVFEFTNTGKTDLIITNAQGSCGCTVPEYPQNIPIAPGGTGSIRVGFNSSNMPNAQIKQVTITANTEAGKETLRIKAMVEPDPVKQKQRDEAAAQQAAAAQQQTN